MADISKIKLPSGNEYDIKDAVARQMIAGGVSFNIVWTATEYSSSSAPTAAKLSTIPAGVIVYYNDGTNSATGTLAASNNTIGKFYLIYSRTQAGTLDLFDEYVTVGASPNYAWEKIGDTQIDLSGVVTDVTLNKSTDTVIGSDASFLVAQPYVSISAYSSGPGAKVAGTIESATTLLSAAATSGSTSWNSKDSKTVLTGITTNNTNIKATASGANVAWNSKDQVTAVTSVTASTSHLDTTTIYGVESTTTSASKATAASTQTTATGGGNVSTTNTDWLKGVSVSNEVLTIGAATMATQSTTQFTFSDVTVPIKNSSTTTVATGTLVSSGGGATVATGVSANGTDTVIGADATFTVTQPTVALSSEATAGTGVISVAYSAAANGTASVIGNSATFTNTQPTITLSKGASGDVTVLDDIYVTHAYLQATASGAEVAWDNKDQVTVLTNNTSLTVTKGE